MATYTGLLGAPLARLGRFLLGRGRSQDVTTVGLVIDLPATSSAFVDLMATSSAMCDLQATSSLFVDLQASGATS